MNKVVIDLFQVLLAMQANVEDRGIKGECTPLMEAASAGHIDIVRLLVAHGADVNAQSSSGTSKINKIWKFTFNSVTRKYNAGVK